LLHNQNTFEIKCRQIGDDIDKLNDNWDQFKVLEKKQKELERYKRETLENHKKKLTEHDDRIQSLESSINELRSNNTREHQEMLVGIHKAETIGARNSEQCTSLWSECRKLGTDIARVRDCGLTSELLN